MFLIKKLFVKIKKNYLFFELFSFTFESFRFYNEININLPKVENQMNYFEENLFDSILLLSQPNEVTNLAFNISLNELSLIAEFFLAFAALVTITYCSLTVYSEFYKKRTLMQFSGTFISILILCFTFILLNKDELIITKHLSMDFSFLSDSLGNFAKVVTVLLSLMCVYLTKNSLTRNKINYNEYDLLILYAILGLLLVTTANDLITIFLTLELQGLSIYVLSGIKRNSMYSVDSGLKYIFIASLSTGYYLLGGSLLFGLSGLLVLVGFHFFFNDFYKIDHEIYLISFEELTELILLLKKLFPNIEEVEKNQKFLIKNTCKNNEKNRLENIFHYNLLLSKKISTDDEIIEYYNKGKIKIKKQELNNNIDCEFCKELLASFKTIDEKGCLNQLFEEPSCIKKKCWFCETLLKEYLKQIEEEKQKRKLIYLKRMQIHENKLPDKLSVEYYKLLDSYFKNRDLTITKEAHEKALSTAFFITCDEAEKYKTEFCIFPCKYIANRFKNAWQIGYIRNTLLTNKIKQACQNLSSDDKEENTNKFCKELKRQLQSINQINNIEQIDKLTNKIKQEKETQNNLSNYFDDTSFFVLLSFSLNFILISFFFKLAGAPFHLWSLDIYEGSPTSSTIFFAVVTKFSIIVILAKICYYGFYSALKKILYQYIIFVSILSAFVGAIAGLREQKLKSLLAYSSINNVGYLLLTLTIGTLNSIKATLFYLIIYISSSLATWSGLISIQIKKNRYIKKQNKDFADLTLIKKTNPMLTLLLHIALFSTAGLPPFIGFLTKMNVFLVSIESHIFLISLVTILLSILSSFYYLRLIKITCFEKVLIGKLHRTIKLNQSSINNVFGFFLPYQFFKPGLSIFFSYKIIVC